ncbi:uncharacterized protein LOC141615572 [Silene latifolia]|uniref:uncharacterized protein LOC141615572 n=1 Tax=Silene latifolia TaxID=37657 RepID=UPI003D77241B
MVVKVVTTPCLQLSPKKTLLNDVVSVSRTAWLGTMSSKLSRTRSFEYKPKQRSHQPIRRACSANFDAHFSGDIEFSKRIEELALSFQLDNENLTGSESTEPDSVDWNPASIEMKANRVDLPISLRMIKRKKNQWRKNVSEIGESACCSVKKAFSSMVFIIRELHSYSMQIREALFFEDLQGILIRVHEEMHASFVWLFQQVFSHTPTLMLYVMILLANFTVHSMSNTYALASQPPVLAAMDGREISSNFDVKSFTVSSSGCDTTSVGGGNGGGNKFNPVASGMDGDDSMRKSSTIVNRLSVSVPEETAVWNSIVEEASRMQGEFREEILESDVTKWFVSPVTAKVETDDYQEYFRTELSYQSELDQEPNNVLLLANYAQFLYLVVHDYDRAEEYFKRAIKVEPKDGEAHNKYATFLWQVRNDLWAAEETYLEAISADPTNSYYAANYAHFLWNTGGEDTCFPLDSQEDSQEDETLDS